MKQDQIIWLVIGIAVGYKIVPGLMGEKLVEDKK